MPQKNNVFKLSIVIPVYNEVNYLERFTNNLTSIFKDENVEFIFINDGSDDNSEHWLKQYIEKQKLQSKKNNFLLANLNINQGKGFAVRKGLEMASGDYILFQDSDLEYNLKDSYEMYKIINNNLDMEVLFGSRFLSGKLKTRKYVINEIICRINTFIFNIIFNQSISDLHCGTKIISRAVAKKINLSINDFGFEIDISSQIAKNNYKIYEYGISYFARTYQEGKKITWIDGLLSYFYFMKTRFIDNELSILFSIIYSSFFMAYVGTYFGMGIGKALIIVLFLIIGSFLGLYNRMFSVSIIFLFIYFGSLFSSGNGKIYSVLIGFFIGIYISRKISFLIRKYLNNKVINFFV